MSWKHFRAVSFPCVCQLMSIWWGGMVYRCVGTKCFFVFCFKIRHLEQRTARYVRTTYSVTFTHILVCIIDEPTQCFKITQISLISKSEIFDNFLLFLGQFRTTFRHDLWDYFCIFTPLCFQVPCRSYMSKANSLHSFQVRSSKFWSENFVLFLTTYNRVFCCIPDTIVTYVMKVLAIVINCQIDC